MSVESRTGVKQVPGGAGAEAPVRDRARVEPIEATFDRAKRGLRPATLVTPRGNHPYQITDARALGLQVHLVDRVGDQPWL